MLVDYEIEIEMTEPCYKSFRKMHRSPEEEMDKIARIAQGFYENGHHDRVRSLNRYIKLQLGLESTMCLIALGRDESALVSIDEDIVERVLLVTIWDYAWRGGREKMLRHLINSLYARYLCAEGEVNDGQ